MFARLRPVLLAAAATFTLLLPTSLFAAPPQDTTQGLLWKIEKDGSSPSYLFGTIHVTDPRVAELRPEVQQALENSEHIGTEIRFEVASMMEMGKAMLTPDPSLAAKLTPERYAKLLPLLESRGYPEVAAAKFKPWAAAMLLMVPKPIKGLIPLDLQMTKHAMENEKDYFGLETVQEQIAFFQNIPEDKQLHLLNALIDQGDKLDASFKPLVDAYLKQDLATLQKMADQDEPTLPAADQAWFKAWMKSLVDERNPVMTKRLIEHLNDGSAFVAVGALHLPGEGGIINRLRQAGYTVTAVSVAK